MSNYITYNIIKIILIYNQDNINKVKGGIKWQGK